MNQGKFSQTYEIIYNKFISNFAGEKWAPSNIGLSKFLGHGHNGKVQAWSKGQWPNAYDCWVIHKKMGFQLEWLLTGEGTPLGVSSPLAPAPVKHQSPSVEDMLFGPKPAQAIPLIGFAGCSTMGWHGSMTYPIAATAPHARPGMIAVMASGESMLPAGIGHGHICFCDPNADPMPGECVYVACHDNKHTLKTFLGWGEAEGHKIHEGELVLRGWLDKHENEPQKDIIIHINRNSVKVVAPVVYVQRRL